MSNDVANQIFWVVMKKDLVVYTVLTGNYGAKLNNPFSDDWTGFERICFTDDVNIESAGWTLVPLGGRCLDPMRESRRPKLLPHRFLPDFEWSLYIDNTIRLKQNPSEFLKTLDTATSNYFCFRHPWRDCVYDEAEEVIRLGYDSQRRVREQMDRYRAAGHPKKAGLTANGVLFRRHHDPAVIQLGEMWFEHVLRYSWRDQLSFNFCAAMLKFEYAALAGTLTDNELTAWPGFEGQRHVPANFNDDVYAWLNPEVTRSGLSPRRHYVSVGAAKNLPYTLKLWDLDRLANKYKTDKGSIYYNANSYAAVYEHYFEPIRQRPLRLLEIGLLRHDVQARNPCGPYDDVPSLLMWREYFPNAEIVGFDIADFSAAPPIPNCRIVRGDMGNPEELLALLNLGQDKSNGFDIIIDDASHASHHQQIALGTLFPYLKDGGYYVIEDLNCQPPQLELPGAKKTKTLLQAIRWQKPFQCEQFAPQQQAYLLNNVESIEFYDGLDRNFGALSQDSLAVIKKRSPAAGVRLGGQVAKGKSNGTWHIASLPHRVRVLLVPPHSRRARALRRLKNAIVRS
jgi:hypothetical protein